MSSMRGFVAAAVEITTAAYIAMALAGCNDVRGAWGGVSTTISDFLVRDAANWADPDDYDAVRAKTVRDVDRRGRPTYQGPIAFVDNDVGGHTYLMRAVLPRDWPIEDRAEPDMLQIYVIASLAQHAGLDRALVRRRGDRGGAHEPLDATPIYQADIVCTRGVCPVREDVGVNLSLAELDRFTAGGVELIVVGPRGQIEFDVPGAYLRAFRDRILEHRAE